MTDPYRVLGVAPTASEDEIKKAYRKLSRLYHPDSNMNKSESEKKAAEEMLEDAKSFFAPEPVKKDKADWDADLAMIDVVMEQIMALEDELENLKKQAEPLNKQLNKWRKIKEAIENDTL